jgi:DNA polymerase III subunit gamma/tau
MGYQVLARKYRPQRFSDVAGQDHVTRTLLNALVQGRIAHGYIFSGHRGIGKTTIARILAMALNCRTSVGTENRPTPEPCGVCESCLEIRGGNAVDVIEIDAATNRGIDEIRELRDAARYSPARDRYKIYILDEAHQITDAAFNALLKTLEEPPEHVIFMMATTEPENIPQTIRSRCQHFSFHAVKFDDILGQLRGIASQENIAAEDPALALLAEAGDGSMRDALSIMDQAIASAPLENGKPNLTTEQIRELMGTVPNSVFERLMEAIGENKSAAVIEEINQLLNAGHSPVSLARQMVRYLRNALMARLGGEHSELLQISADERARANRTALLFTEEDLTRFLQMMLRTFDELNYRQEQRFHLELGLLKLVHAQRLLPLEQFLSQLPVSGAVAASSSSGGSSRGGGLPARPTPSTPPASPSSSGPRPAAPNTAQPPSAPSQPTFSPFEADRLRKQNERMESSVPSVEATELRTTVTPFTPPVEMMPPPAPRALTPLEVVASDTASSPFPPASTLTSGMLTMETTEGSLAVAVETAVETSVAVADTSDLDSLRDAVCAALEEGGHNTAAALLSGGRWTLEGSNIKAEVAAKKTMLSLTMNAEADKIARNALRNTGSNHKLVVVPGEGLSTPAGNAPGKPRIPQGSIQTKALEHPLVKQAQQLFRAEVRSVLDLREK